MRRGNILLTKQVLIFPRMKPYRQAAPIIRKRIIIVIYWVAYQRGSFNLKERYACPDRAHNRCGDLFAKARHIRMVPAEEAEPHFLRHCFELPAIG